MNLHPELEPLLRHFVSQLEGLFGRDLINCSAFGPVASGEFSAGLTEVNLLLVLSRLGPDEMRKLVGPIQAARKELLIDPMLFTPKDLSRSTDVLPLQLLDVQRNYVVLSGEDLLAHIFISPEHSRMACEQEVKKMVMRLRQIYLTRAGLRPVWQDALAESARPALRLASVAMSLTGRSVPASTDALLEMAEKEIGLNQQVFMRALMLHVNGDRLAHAELDQLFEGFLESLVKLADYTDALSPT